MLCSLVASGPACELLQAGLLLAFISVQSTYHTALMARAVTVVLHGLRLRLMSMPSSSWRAGIVYGLQPDALFVVIPALALPTRLAAVAYMAMFVVGTMAAMGGYTAIIGATPARLMIQ